MGLGSGAHGNNGKGASADQGHSAGGGIGGGNTGGNRHESSGGRGRNGYGAGNRSKQQASDLADRQDDGDQKRSWGGLNFKTDRRAQYASSALDVFDPHSSTRYNGLTESEIGQLTDLQSKGDLTNGYADTEFDTLRDAEKQLDRVRDGAASINRDSHERDGLAALAPVTSTMAGDPKLASKLGLNEEERTALSRDIAGKKSNGLLGSLIGFLPGVGMLASAAFNGTTDAKQANEFSKDAWGIERTTKESWGDGLNAITRGAASTLASIVGGRVLGPAAGLINQVAGNPIKDAFAPNVENYGKPNANTQMASRDGNTDNESTDVQAGSAAPQIASNTTSYDSSLGNYASHHQNFVYNSNSAVQAWR